MKRTIIIILIIAPFLVTQQAKSQDVYAISSWESLFQWADVSGTPQNSTNITEKLRYTIVLNVGQYWNVDFSNSIGLYSGLAIRNVTPSSKVTRQALMARRRSRVSLTSYLSMPLY